MTDVLERLRADNPVCTGSAPSIDEVWARLERDSVAPRRRPRPARAVALGLLALVPVALVVIFALTTRGSSRAPAASDTPGSGGVLVHYRTRTVIRPVTISGVSSGYEIDVAEVWVAGAWRHLVKTEQFFSRSGRPAGAPQQLEDATDGRRLEHFVSGLLSPAGALEEGPAGPAGQQNAACPLIVACPSGVSVDPLSEVRRLYRTGALVLMAKGRRLDGHTVDQLKTATRSKVRSGVVTLMFVDPRSFMPLEIITRLAGLVATTTISDYRRLPLTVSNRGLLRMRPHPGARRMCAAPGDGGPPRPARPASNGCFSSLG